MISSYLKSISINTKLGYFVRHVSTTQSLFRRRISINKSFSPILNTLDSNDLNIMEEAFTDAEITYKTLQSVSNSIDYSNRPLTGEKFEDGSRRIGMVGIKIGMLPQWCRTRGERVLCTAVHFPDNEVISVIDPETWYKTSQVGKRKAYTRYGPMYKVCCFIF